MRDQQRRLKTLEQRYIRSIVADMARAYGIDVDEFVEDIRRFLALSDAEQDAELVESLAVAEAHGDVDDVRILREGWDAIRSYR